MIVVADSSPVNYLILIEEIDILAKLYGTIAIPPTVRQELLSSSAPEVVRRWVLQAPTWLQVRSPVKTQETVLAKLDPGERDAIALAAELEADQLIVDDRQGRREAGRRGIAVMGTLGVLREAGRLGLVDLRTAVKLLEATSFHIAPEVLDRLLKHER